RAFQWVWGRACRTPDTGLKCNRCCERGCTSAPRGGHGERLRIDHIFRSPDPNPASRTPAPTRDANANANAGTVHAPATAAFAFAFAFACGDGEGTGPEHSAGVRSRSTLDL